ncbi:MAG: hypothetical protein KIS78_14325 [Labilithrix sp.]|nr:hypothetical protein [Labilithrix sp.]MCW5833575.1 hypothetical protein [Labilithrix sp.]
MRRTRRTLLAAGAVLSVATTSRSSDAAERWVDRPMTQHRLVFAGDVGLGVGHFRFRGPLNNDVSNTGLGMNLEGALGVTERLELGFRTGLRFGNDGRATGADSYGRTLWTETYGTGGDAVANPELRLRWVAYSGSVAEVGLDGRVFLPVEDGTRFGVMFGVPLTFHVADFARIDTGAYIPVVFHNPAFNGLSIPGYFWFQTSERLWLGPMAQLRFIDPGGADHDAHLLLGFGLGYQAASAVDIKTMILFPTVDDDIVRRFGAGVGVQFRIGE